MKINPNKYPKNLKNLYNKEEKNLWMMIAIKSKIIIPTIKRKR